jgi:hypothetical protein
MDIAVTVLLGLSLAGWGLMAGVVLSDRKDRRAAAAAHAAQKAELVDLVGTINKTHNELVHQVAALNERVSQAELQRAGRPGPTRGQFPSQSS